MGTFRMASMMLFLMICIAYLASVKSLPTCEEYLKKKCSQGTFKCAPYATCCQKNSEMCSSLSGACEDVFAPGEDKHYVCCNALSTNDTTREGLIEACTYRLGSETWPEYCEAKYHGEPQDEQSSTVAETYPTMMAKTTGSILLLSLVPTQPNEQQTPSSEPCSVKEEHCVWQSLLVCALILIVGVLFAHKTWVREKCRQILRIVFGECQVCHACQCGDTTSIEINSPKSQTNLPAFGHKPNPMNVNPREGWVAPKGGKRDTAPVTDQPVMDGGDLVLHRGHVVLAKAENSSEEAAKLLDQSTKL